MVEKYNCEELVVFFSVEHLPTLHPGHWSVESCFCKRYNVLLRKRIFLTLESVKPPEILQRLQAQFGNELLKNMCDCRKQWSMSPLMKVTALSMMITVWRSWKWLPRFKKIIIEELGYRKVFGGWFQDLSDEHKQKSRARESKQSVRREGSHRSIILPRSSCQVLNFKLYKFSNSSNIWNLSC